ncbi:hypothetical protein SGR_1543 [Streptomyces griseus subsp. griseus NBRC 13350]|uniref:Uncharacterized protein n=1 Tax=Streptomyces griseus subsp. griseus (strain JCM 4626 / CBS 651.72 / NBRC 13350 / KCC S-0626 / ISP 5235) TaxID=455632 RepID=B1VWP6_STRGG|nr:hypothetical protein SGR_1543 [Streptomyces griseus subsp. griseus NBRC 13350]
MNRPGGTFPRVRPAAPSGPTAVPTDGGRGGAGHRRPGRAVGHTDSRPAPAAPVSGKITGATAVSTVPRWSSPRRHRAGPRLRLLTRPDQRRAGQSAASGRARQDPRPEGRSSNLTFGAE